jgi:hypothetical protein
MRDMHEPYYMSNDDFEKCEDWRKTTLGGNESFLSNLID